MKAITLQTKKKGSDRGRGKGHPAFPPLPPSCPFPSRPTRQWCLSAVAFSFFYYDKGLVIIIKGSGSVRASLSRSHTSAHTLTHTSGFSLIMLPGSPSCPLSYTLCSQSLLPPFFSFLFFPFPPQPLLLYFHFLLFIKIHI